MQHYYPADEEPYEAKKDHTIVYPSALTKSLSPEELLPLAKKIKECRGLIQELAAQARPLRNSSLDFTDLREKEFPPDFQYRQFCKIKARLLLNRDKIVYANLLGAKSVALTFSPCGTIETEDLIQEANIGLMVAAHKIDPEKIKSWGSFASWWARAYILRAFANQSQTIRLPEAVYQKFVKLYRQDYESLTFEQRAFIDSVPLTVSHDFHSEDI